MTCMWYTLIHTHTIIPILLSSTVPALVGGLALDDASIIVLIVWPGLELLVLVVYGIMVLDEDVSSTVV